MNTITRIFTSLLFSIFLAGYCHAQTVEEGTTSDIQSMIETLNEDIADLNFLSKQIGDLAELDSDVLLYRRDVRSFRALGDFDALVTALTKLSGDNSQRKQYEAKLSELALGVGDAIFNRISEINQRIVNSTEMMRSMSGGTRVSTQAAIDGMEGIRLNYYEALVNHIQSLKALGLVSDNLHQRLDPIIHIYAETLAGRIELNSVSHKELRSQAEQDPGNADVKSVLKHLDVRHNVDIRRLHTIIRVLDELELDSADYKAVLLQQSANLSVSFFSSKALISVLKDSWSGLKETIAEKAPDFLFRAIIFIAILFAFRVLSRMTAKAVRVATESSKFDTSALLKRILISSSSGIVMGIGVLVALGQIGITLGPMLAGLGLAGFIVGFALQDTLGNFAAGAMILIYRPFDVNDFVEVTGASGLVQKMNLVSTTITTFDNQTLVVPNGKIWGDVIKNVTAQKERRVDLIFGIGYEDDIEKAEKVLDEIVTQHKKVLKQPEPNIRLHTLGDSSVDFIVRPWTKTEDYWEVYWDITREVKLRFDREGISIPYPQRDIHLYSEKNA